MIECQHASIHCSYTMFYIYSKHGSSINFTYTKDRSSIEYTKQKSSEYKLYIYIK